MIKLSQDRTRGTYTEEFSTGCLERGASVSESAEADLLAVKTSTQVSWCSLSLGLLTTPSVRTLQDFGARGGEPGAKNEDALLEWNPLMELLYPQSAGASRPGSLPSLCVTNLSRRITTLLAVWDLTSSPLPIPFLHGNPSLISPLLEKKNWGEGTKESICWNIVSLNVEPKLKYLAEERSKSVLGKGKTFQKLGVEKEI